MKRRNEIDSAQIAYIHGRIEAEIEGFAKALNISMGQLAYKVASLLLSQTNREILGTESNMSQMRRNSAKRSKTVAKVALVKRTLSEAQLKAMRANAKKARVAKLANIRAAKLRYSA